MTDAQDADNTRLRVYCRSWCGDCARAFRWLDERGIEYDKLDVEEDESALRFAESLNGGRLHTPTFCYGDLSCVDFKVDWLCEVLGVEP
jgi:mycoredoxin